MKRNRRILISGGGTGGHVFPAIAIANALKAKDPDVEILFVGADNRMEMEKVPAAGYPIVGLPVAGIDRKRIWRNFGVLTKLFRSLRLASRTVRDFRPDVAVGVGGYASGPTLWTAARKKIPVVIQEQNSYAGVTNKLLARKAHRICVAYDGMERFFPGEKLAVTGNPVRQNLLDPQLTREAAVRFFGLDPTRPVLLVIGGSLGARQINESVAAYLDQFSGGSVQLIWQTGRAFDDRARSLLSEKQLPDVVQMPFVARMDMAYKAADLVISRAGASSISELSLLGKPAILVPSPNVAEDHQTKNATALSSRGAALQVADSEAPRILIPLALHTLQQPERLRELSERIVRMAYPDSAARIADLILNLISNREA